MKHMYIDKLVMEEIAAVELDSQVVAITLHEPGYTPIYTKSNADILNGFSIPKDVIESAVIGSMFGWGSPGARKAIQFMETEAWYTVILLRADYMTDNYGQDTYMAHIEAPSAKDAVRLARQEVIADYLDGTEPEGMACEPEDLYVIAVFKGKHDDLWVSETSEG